MSMCAFSFSSKGQTIRVNVTYRDKPAQSADTLYYTPGIRLRWPDFQGAPDPTTSAGAVTASGFAFHAVTLHHGSVVQVNIQVYAYFTKHDSWKKPEVNSDYYLLHEQNHFNITYLSTLKFMDRIKKTKFTVRNINRQLNDLFDQAYQENNRLQNQYDTATSNSINKEQQEKWNQKIKEWLSQSFNNQLATY